MTPLPKRPLNADDEVRVRAAVDARESAEAELHAAVIAAAVNGASVRELALATGLSTSTISAWKRDSGRFR